MARLLAFAFFVALTVGCTTSVNIHSSVSPTARFDVYRTFAFGSDPGAPADFAESPESERIERMVAAIAADVLEGKGYVRVASPPADLTIRVAAGQRERAIHRTLPRRPPWFAEDEEFDYDEGTFVIDAFDTGSSQLVWHGSARREIEPGHIDPDRLRQAVAGVLATFPARTVKPVAVTWESRRAGSAIRR